MNSSSFFTLTSNLTMLWSKLKKKRRTLCYYTFLQAIQIWNQNKKIQIFKYWFFLWKMGYFRLIFPAVHYSNVFFWHTWASLGLQPADNGKWHTWAQRPYNRDKIRQYSLKHRLLNEVAFHITSSLVSCHMASVSLR